jgi:hypothetical protein
MSGRVFVDESSDGEMVSPGSRCTIESPQKEFDANVQHTQSRYRSAQSTKFGFFQVAAQYCRSDTRRNTVEPREQNMLLRISIVGVSNILIIAIHAAASSSRT